MTTFNFTRPGLLTAALLLTACAPKPPAFNGDNLPRSTAPTLTAPDNEAPPPPTSGYAQAKSKSTKDGSETDKSKPVDDKPAKITDKTVKSDSKTSKTDTAASAAVAGQAAKVSSWDISGAMAARSKSKAWSASINWLQQGAGSYQIRLFGPLGSGTVMIQKQGGRITFRDGAKSSSSSNADQLLMQQTGVRLPVSSLYYWVRGIPAPGAVQSAKKDKSQHLQLLRQSGYTIEYTGYTRVANIDLPSQIRLQGNGIFIKLVIKRWKI